MLGKEVIHFHDSNHTSKGFYERTMCCCVVVTTTPQGTVQRLPILLHGKNYASQIQKHLNGYFGYMAL